ncbi:hypothetical protein KR222_010663 [Zaprionus bogoriensis]|nr:hypothetical protein KR222_010663 [Zaprionus bogoriensis]
MQAEQCFNKVTHVIFDNDGTLMDSENVYTMAADFVLKPYGHNFTYEQKLRAMGRPARVLVRMLIDEYSVPLDEEEFLRQFEVESERLLANVQLMPGARELMLHLHDMRIPMAVATSSYHSGFQHKASSHCDILSVLHHVVCGDDPELKSGKPAPDIYLLAASRFNPAPKPECCLVFEDSPSGLQAGLAAGMQVVMTPDPRVPAEKLAGATQVLPSMADFQPELFGLPCRDNMEKFTFG